MKKVYYGWVIVLIGACVLTTYGLVFYSFGIFLVPLTTEFGWDRGTLSFAVSINMLVQAALVIFAGRLSDRYGPRVLITLTGILTGLACLLLSRANFLWQVYLSWGLIVGVASACCFTPIISTVPKWFVKQRGVAVGLAGIGFGLGAIISPLLVQWLIYTYDWRQAYVILGLITFVIITPIAQFMKHSPQRIGLKPYGENENVENISEETQASSLANKELSFTQAIKTSHFRLFAIIHFCFFFCMQVVLVHTVPYAIDVGISGVIAAGILSIMGGISVVSRLTIGFVSDRIGSRLILTGCLVVAAMAFICLLFAREIGLFYVFAILFGIGYGGIMLLQSLIAAELFGVKSLGVILAGLILCGMIGSAFGAPLAGSIFDITGSYSLALLICVVLSAVSIISSLVLLRSKGKEGV